MKKVIISAAITGGQPPRPENENKPLTPKQIAQVLGISEGNARTRLYRARAALEKRMKEEGLL